MSEHVVKGLPDEIWHRLAELADDEGKSLDDYIVQELTRLMYTRPNPRWVGSCPECGSGPGESCTGRPYGGVHRQRLDSNGVQPSEVPGYLESMRASVRRRSPQRAR